MPNPIPGTLIGPYQIEDALGAGSMGDVFRGIDTGLGRRVAIKLLAEKHRDSQELRARFVREGRAVAAISHPNVVQVFATGTFDDRPYIAMEFLAGTDLDSLVERDGPLPAFDAARAVRDAAFGLAAAAEAGLIHRDVKPSNLVRLGDGQVKVTDFGLAKPLDPGSEPSLTAMGVVVGTPDFIAPEQARGETITPGVDIYALGGTLYFLLTGAPPFRTGVPAEDKYLKVVTRHLKQPAPDALARNPKASPELAQLAQQMMAKKPGDRPTYLELLERLDDLMVQWAPSTRLRTPVGLRVSGASVAPPLRDSTAVAPTARSSADSVGSLHSELRRARGITPTWAWVVVGLSTVFFVVSVVYYLARKGNSTEASQAPPRAALAAPPDALPSLPSDAAIAPAPAPSPPPGMVLVSRSDRSPWFFVGKAAVTHAEYAAFYPKHKVPRNAGAAPVTGVDYHFARAFAQTSGKRMLRDDEWDAASKTPGFAAAVGLFEWVDSGKTEAPLVRRGAKVEPRKSAARDVTFRLAQDLPR
jgi:serine/threonine-protein kinase